MRQSIGIDDGSAAAHPRGVRQPASPPPPAAFAELFRAVYLRFHRRDRKRSELTGPMRGVLQHLSIAGPLTIGEAARHFDRAQSVVSEIADRLEGKGLVERVRDPRDARRTLIWLTEAGIAALERDRQVLDLPLLARALGKMPDGQAAALLETMRALVEAADHQPPRDHAPRTRRRTP